MKYEELGSVETINFLYRLQCAYSSSKSTKDVFNVQEMWNSPNVLHTNDPFFFWCFNTTFSNMSAMSWRPGLVVEEAGVPGENHRTWGSNW